MAFVLKTYFNLICKCKFSRWNIKDMLLMLALFSLFNLGRHFTPCEMLMELKYHVNQLLFETGVLSSVTLVGTLVSLRNLKIFHNH